MNCLPTISKQEEVSKQNSSDLFRKPYDYFSTKIPKSHIEMILKVVKDERFLFFIKYGLLRRYDGDCEIIYVEIPQIPKKLVIYRRPCIRMKSPEKLNLSNRDLPHIPLFEGEENLKVLSLEMNLITKIDQLISLNNLSYLNLYFNKIKEIENLQTTSHLRVLLLGKNQIERIKNVHILLDLEILDLHSNQIKHIENLSQLKKLRILNIANNQITSIIELLANKNLEELNVRKNAIISLPNLTNSWERMKKINLGKNLIAKIEYLIELRKIKSLLEVSLEENPVVLIKESFEILKTIPKVNFNFSKKNLLLISGGTKNPYTTDIQLHHQRQQPPNNARCSSPSFLPLEVINEHNNNKANHTNTLTCIGPFGRNNILISKEQYSQTSNTQSIIKSIESKWLFEYTQIIKLGYNGYRNSNINNKRVKEAKAMFGHIETSNDKTALVCYGDVLRQLFHDESYQNVTSIQFNYFYYDTIMHRKNIERFQNFKELKTILFCDNNIHSFYQLTKLELFPYLEVIGIKNNEVSLAGMTKYFLVYRVQDLKRFNDEDINEDDRVIAKEIFKYFDKCISYCDYSKGNGNSNNNRNKSKDIDTDKDTVPDNNKKNNTNRSTSTFYPSIKDSAEMMNKNKANDCEYNNKDEVEVEDCKGNSNNNNNNNISLKVKEYQQQQTHQEYKDNQKFKMLSNIKSNLELIMKEIIYDYINDD